MKQRNSFRAHYSLHALQVDGKTFHMQVDIEKFEEKLRAAEAKLGIKAGHGIPVVYERGEDAIGKFLTSLIIGGILLSLFARGRGFKAPGFTDAFVSISKVFSQLLLIARDCLCKVSFIL